VSVTSSSPGDGDRVGSRVCERTRLDR